MSEIWYRTLRQSVEDGDPDAVAEGVRAALADGLSPLDIIHQALVPGLDSVGEQYARGEMFLPDLVLAGEAMKTAMAILEPMLRDRGLQRETLGRVVLGTVHGDIHEIGKTLVGTLLAANGFEVHDLGVDVPSERFAEKAAEVGAQIVGASALLTTTMVGQRDVILALERAHLRPTVKVMVGGAPVTPDWAREIGADGYAADAVAAVALARRLLGLE